MNELNNVIIEGVVVAVKEQDPNDPDLTVVLLRNRESMVDFYIITDGSMGRNVRNTLKPGEIIRAAGRLVHDGAWIAPDHMEYVPAKVNLNG